jgi:hypothetical protein
MGRIVIACYRPKPGKSAELEELMKTHLSTLAAEGLVTDRTSILMKAGDGTVLEVFEWKSKDAIASAHTNPRVVAMWERYGAVCDYVPLTTIAEAKEMFAEFTPFSID